MVKLDIAKQRIRKGIESYKHRQNVLLRLIRMQKGLTSEKFDEIFRGREYRKRCRRIPIAGDSFLLGITENGFNEWTWHLELLQLMIAIDLVEVKSDGMVTYFLKEVKNEIQDDYRK